jgi:hypothetical protein
MRRDSDRWYRRIVRDCKCSDFKAGREVDLKTYIQSDQLEGLQDTQENLCYYCQEQMDWLERRSARNGLTCERLDNTRPHEADNCKLCCKRCNSRKFSHDKGLLMRFFCLWKHNALDIRMPQTNRRCSFV